MDKREKILEAALKLFVEYGFHGTPTSKIASEAGVSNGTLFHYFKTKEELILALYGVSKSEMNDFLLDAVDTADDLVTKGKTVVAQSVRWALAHPQKFHYIHQVYFSPYAAQIPLEDVQKYMKLYIELLETGQKEGIIKSLPIDFIISIVSNHIFGIYQYLLHNAKEEPEQIIDKAIEMVWDMITV